MTKPIRRPETCRDCAFFHAYSDMVGIEHRKCDKRPDMRRFTLEACRDGRKRELTKMEINDAKIKAEIKATLSNIEGLLLTMERLGADRLTAYKVLRDNELLNDEKLYSEYALVMRDLSNRDADVRNAVRNIVELAISNVVAAGAAEDAKKAKAAKKGGK